MLTVPAMLIEFGATPSKPGEFSIRGNRFVICCPCGCGDIIGIRHAETDLDKGACWQWDGNREKPTVTPSIQVIGGCNWHGYLKAGVFETC